MKTEFRQLSEDLKPEIYRTFIEAFSDYELDMSYMTEEITWNRAEKNRVDFPASVGAFSDGRMIGFTLVGIDDWKEEKRYAYDIVTGIVKDHRGKGIARGMFDAIVPGLKAKGVERFALEVLQGNKPAIKAYEKAGFSIVRELDCYQLALEPLGGGVMSETVAVEECSREALEYFTGDLEWEPSWENSFNAIRSIPDEIVVLCASIDRVRAGILVYYPALNWIMTILTRRSMRGRGVASALLDSLIRWIDGSRDSLRLVNVDHSDEGMSGFLFNRGFERFVGQYEMEMELQGGGEER